MTPTRLPTPSLLNSLKMLSIVVAGLGALATAIIVSAKFLTVPTRLEAAEQVNAKQDDAIQRLVTLQEFYAREQKVEEVEDDGEIKIMRLGQDKLCCNGHTCWPYHATRKCRR